MDSDLKTEIAGKIEGDLKTFLLAFIDVILILSGLFKKKILLHNVDVFQNDNLDDERINEKKAISSAQALKKTFTITDGPFLDSIKNDGRLQLKQLFLEYKNVKQILFQVEESFKDLKEIIILFF